MKEWEPKRVRGSITVSWDEGPFHVTQEWYIGHHAKVDFFGGDKERADKSDARVLCVKGWHGENQTMVE